MNHIISKLRQELAHAGIAVPLRALDGVLRLLLDGARGQALR